MALEHIAQEWKIDSVIDPNDVSEEIRRTPKLHQKYLDLLMAYKFKVKTLELQRAKLHREKSDYFGGRSEKPSPVRILKGEVSSYVDADDDYQKIDLKLETNRLCVLYLEKIVKMIETRSYDLKTALEWAKFSSGR